MEYYWKVNGIKLATRSYTITTTRYYCITPYVTTKVYRYKHGAFQYNKHGRLLLHFHSYFSSASFNHFLPCNSPPDNICLKNVLFFLIFPVSWLVCCSSKLLAHIHTVIIVCILFQGLDQSPLGQLYMQKCCKNLLNYMLFHYYLYSIFLSSL
jgi:hypothetical protein